jgi:hypothetical protein
MFLLDMTRHAWSFFAPQKYVLNHSLKKKQNLSIIPLELPTSALRPSPYARILGLIVDSKLYWHPHIAHIKSKLRTQTFTLTRLTWGAPFSSCCLLYASIVYPAIAYASTACYSALKNPYALKYVLSDHTPLQNKCLRAIFVAYWAT